jgi:ABC-type oligopeptide transport system substrate-binding subunit
VRAGPYQIQNFDKQNGTITFVRNPKWWGKTGRLDSRTFLTMESAASINAFKNGQLDATGVATKDRRGDEGTRTLNPRLAKVRPITVCEQGSALVHSP